MRIRVHWREPIREQCSIRGRENNISAQLVFIITAFVIYLFLIKNLLISRTNSLKGQLHALRVSSFIPES